MWGAVEAGLRGSKEDGEAHSKEEEKQEFSVLDIKAGDPRRISTLMFDLESKPMKTKRGPRARDNCFLCALSHFCTEVTKGKW